MISSEAVMELRKRTGLGIMDCKKALVAVQGDLAAAEESLREVSARAAEKKAGRVASEGAILTRVAEDESFGVIVEINCETDFVARDNTFLTFCRLVLDTIYTGGTTDVQELLHSGLEKSRQTLVQKVGENVLLKRASRLGCEGASGGKCAVGSYTHGNNRIGTLVAVKGADPRLRKDLAMHVAAMNPSFVSIGDVPPSVVDEKTRELYSEAGATNKPPEIVGKIVDGRLRKFLEGMVLLEQSFVKDDTAKVLELLTKADARVLDFLRYEVGAGE